MTARRLIAALVAFAALVAIQLSVFAQQPAPAAGSASGDARTFNTATGQRIRVTTVASGLVHPYSLAFPDAQTILVAERSGRLRVIKDGRLLPTPAWEAPAPPPGSPRSNNEPDRLHFIALHPAFARNHMVYLSYPKYGPRGNAIAFGRGVLKGDAIADFTELFVADAWESFGANPGQMLFMNDGTLLLTVGDRDKYCCDGSENTSQRMKAQSLDNYYG
jgi:glucose/arabinose dehydrogenase